MAFRRRWSFRRSRGRRPVRRTIRRARRSSGLRQRVGFRM